MLKKILWDNQNRRQIWGAIIGAFLGLFLLLSAIQLNQDIRSLTQGKGEDRYVLINKKVDFFNTLGAPVNIGQGEIDTLLQQDFIKSVGQFTQNRYRVSASSARLGFYTEMFFESVEDEYLDIQPRKFKWEEGQETLPIIISKDYLALYNFGFAPSQGLPPFTQSTIKKVWVDITVKGSTLRKTFSGQIVGFSDRINSVLVPQNFMDWANKKLGSNSSEGNVSRLILETDNPYSQELQTYLKDKGYEVAAGKLIGGQVGIIVNIILGIIAFIGLIITILSILVFVLNFELIISRSSTEIGLLSQMGYKTKQISDLLINRLMRIFGSVLAAALVALLIGHFFLSKWLVTQSFEVSAGLHWTVYLATLILGGIFFLVTIRSIKERVKELFV